VCVAETDGQLPFETMSDGERRPKRVGFGAGDKPINVFFGALKIAGPLAENGDPDAQLLSGEIFLNGAAEGREKDGQNAALMWFYKAGRAKNAEAQAAYASVLAANGSPGKAAVAEIQLAADLGSPAGQLLESDVYLKGLYTDMVPKDEQAGEKWMALAARGGSPTAQLAFAHRLSARKDLVEAYRWALAASKHPLVDKFSDPLHALTNAWTPEQLADARKLLQELKGAMTSAQIQEVLSRGAP